MKIIELDYSDYKMYNPVKDDVIIDDELNGKASGFDHSLLDYFGHQKPKLSA